MNLVWGGCRVHCLESLDNRLTNYGCRSSHSIYSTFGMVKRPQSDGNEDAPFRSAGGSSGGSAAAVAANLCHG